VGRSATPSKARIQRSVAPKIAAIVGMLLSPINQGR
jgi:hypothetical protein